ncbi:MAG: hypothetical protein ACJATT_000395 [Myxococcota bacterium]|jgi:hypothetical protein
MSEAERPSIGFAIAGWVPAFGVLGTALGTLLQLTGRVESVGPTALRVAGLGLLLGAIAGWVDQRTALTRPPLADGRHQLRHHGDAWVMVTPLVLAGLGFLALVVLATVQSTSPLLGGGFFAAALLAFGFTRPIWTRMRLARAAEAQASGNREQARLAWRTLVKNPLCTKPGRVQAHLNLGLAELINGELADAEHHYAQVSHGHAAPFAQTGTALVRVLKGDYAGAETAIAAASSATRAVQGEVDGVRLLLTLRRDGPDAAIELGFRLRNEASGSLFLGVLAAAYRTRERHEDAADVLTAEVEQALVASGLDHVISELKKNQVDW